MDATLRQYVDAHLDETLETLKRLCAQPSVSAQNYGIRECAELVRQLLEEAGLTAQILPTADERYPVVYGERHGTSPKTLLFYNHYDVQPADPLDLWHSPPFQPTERESLIYARGVSDDKGHLVARLAAIQALLNTRGQLPCRVKFCIEGAEEIGSPGIEEFVESHRDLLQAGVCIWEGGGVNWQGQPAISLGVKGIAYVELECRAAAADSHSSYAPVVPNPAWRLVWALSTLKDAEENIRIRGFYDAVRTPTPAEVEAIKAMPSEEDRLKESLGIQRVVHDARGFEFRRRLYLDPTCTICGIESGYTGEGSKTILPAWARAKVDFRLVPDQDPDDIVARLKAHLEERGFEDIQIRTLGNEHPARTPVDDPWAALVANAARAAYEKEPLLVPTSPGTGPMYPFQQILRLPVASCGIDYPDNHIHAPNENIRTDYFRLGVLHTLEVLDRFGAS